MAVALTLAAGCGSLPGQRADEELLVEKALGTALAGERSEFVSLVAPSFLEEVRAEMPDAGDETLGGILIAGFREDIPFAAVREAAYEVETEGDEAVVHVWGAFLGSGGEEMDIPEAEALRFPLVREGGRWYLDLLDL